VSRERGSDLADRLLAELAPQAAPTEAVREHVRRLVQSYANETSSAVWAAERRRTHRLVTATALAVASVCAVVLEVLRQWGGL